MEIKYCPGLILKNKKLLKFLRMVIGSVPISEIRTSLLMEPVVALTKLKRESILKP